MQIKNLSVRYATSQCARFTVLSESVSRVLASIPQINNLSTVVDN
jgi:hypothetical protein